MDAEELETVIDTGEGQYTEFKSKANNFAKEIVAFANSSGGRLIIGVNNDGEYMQLGNLNDIKSKIRNTARNCEDPVPIEEIEQVDGRLVVHIPESSKSHRCSDGWYIREGANSQKQSKEEIIKILQRKREIQFGNTFSSRFSYPEDFDADAYKQFLEEAGITNNITPEELLENLGVVETRGGTVDFTNAGILMFAENPKKFFTHAEIVCNAYETQDKVEIKDREVIEKPIIPSIRSAVSFIEENIGSRVVIEDLKRSEVLEIPKEALREAVANAIMHRDYHNDSESIHIDIFPDEIEIRNPGGLIEGMRQEDLGHKSMRRNQLLANMLDKAEFVERSGTGINRMEKAMESYNLPKPEFDTNSHFSVTLKRTGDRESYEFDESDLTERQGYAIRKLYESDKITSSEYKQLVNSNLQGEDISKRTAQRDLKSLIDKGYLSRESVGNKTYYVLKDRKI